MEMAENNFKLSLEAKQDHVPTLLAYAKLLDHIGKPKYAEEKFQRAYELNPQLAVTLKLYSK